MHHAGHLLHMLSSYTHPVQSRGSRLHSVSSSLQNCALLPSQVVLQGYLTNIWFLTLLLLSTCALAHSHKGRYRLKGHSLPRGWYSCSLESGIFLSGGPWQHVEKVHFLSGGSLYVCMCILFT